MATKNNQRTFSVEDVKKLKGKGHKILKDIESMCKACNVKLDKTDEMTMYCDNPDVLDILVENIERDKLGGDSGGDLSRNVHVNGKTVTYSWRFSEIASPIVKHFYIDNIEQMVNRTNCSWRMENKEKGKKGKCLTLRSSSEHVSIINSSIKTIIEEYRALEHNEIAYFVDQNAKQFCKENSSTKAFYWINKKADKLCIYSKSKESAKQLQEDWNSYQTKLKTLNESKDAIRNDGDEKKSEEKEKIEEEKKNGIQEHELEKQQVNSETSSSPVLKYDEQNYAQNENDASLQASANLETLDSEWDLQPSIVKPKMTVPGNYSIVHEQDSLDQSFQNKTNTADIVGKARSQHPKYEFSVGKLRVFVYKKSVTEIKGMDAIVNAANDQLCHAGGIAGYISKAAGQKMDDECRDYIKKKGPLKDSDVFISKPGKMACKAIFHAVGPRWSDYYGKEDKCAEVLHRTIHNCLQEMIQNRWRSIAMCAISSGIFGVPKKLCTTIYLKVFEDFATQNPQSVIDVHFIDVVPDILDLLIETHKERVKNGRSPDFSVAFDFKSNYKSYYNPHNRGRQGGFGPFDKRGWTEVTFDEANIPNSKQCNIGHKHRTQNETKNAEKVTKVKKKDTPKDTPEVTCCYDKKKAEKIFECGHGYCSICLPNMKYGCKQCKMQTDKDNKTDNMPENASKTKKDIQDTAEQRCDVCLEDMLEPETLPCQHTFCKTCVEGMTKVKPVCPVCSKPFGIETGSQPDGQMFYKIYKDKSLPGYEKQGTIEIAYLFPDGRQQSDHPEPGKPYRGIERHAYLPDNNKGRKVLGMLKIAFLRRLTFTIGDSRTTGQKGVITWNDIHHKTSFQRDGSYGYPDPGFLDRVTEELAAKGIKE